MRRKAKKWVLNLWTIALAILSAGGINPLEGLDARLLDAELETTIVRDSEAWIEVRSNSCDLCILNEYSIDSQPGCLKMRAS